MTTPLRNLAALWVAVGWIACSGPFLLVSGGALEGTPSPVPDSWAFTDDIDTIQLETHPPEPYSVNLWIAREGELLYVHAGAERSTWVGAHGGRPAGPLEGR